MACFVPFNTTNMEISLLVFRPTVVEVDDVVEGLKHFSLCTEGHGCLHSAILRSIHGNMIIWYGAWMKRSDENKDSLSAAFSSMLTNVSSMAILIDQSFFEAYAGESREGCQAAKIFTGDIVSLNSTTLSTDDMNKNYFSYACLAIFRTRFLKMEGATAGVCLKSQTMSRVVGLFVWKSLHHCYSYILNTDYRETILPYLEGHSLDIKYDIFRVAYVSSNNAADIQFFSSSRLWQNDVEGKGGFPVTQDFERKGQDINMLQSLKRAWIQALPTKRDIAEGTNSETAHFLFPRLVLNAAVREAKPFKWINEISIMKVIQYEGLPVGDIV